MSKTQGDQLFNCGENYPTSYSTGSLLTYCTSFLSLTSFLPSLPLWLSACPFPFFDFVLKPFSFLFLVNADLAFPPHLSLRLNFFVPLALGITFRFSLFLYIWLSLPDFPHLIQFFLEVVRGGGGVQISAFLEEKGRHLLHHHICETVSAALVTDLARQAFSLTCLSSLRAAIEPWLQHPLRKHKEGVGPSPDADPHTGYPVCVGQDFVRSIQFLSVLLKPS